MAQNRAVVSVEHPGPLLLHLEALVGTDIFQQRIEEVSKELASTREGADETAAAIERWVTVAIDAARGSSIGSNISELVTQR